MSRACSSPTAARSVPRPVPDGCDLLGREAFDRGDLVATRAPPTRARPRRARAPDARAPGGDSRAALDALDPQGTIDIE
jgi:hypothetical protein